MNLNLIVLFLLLCCFVACKPLTVVQLIQNDKAEVVRLASDTKSVQYIPMHHVGKPVFYEGVKMLVDSFKRNGYIVFYESARTENITDSLTLDRYNRKFRKMMGMHIDTSGYAKMLHESGLFKQLIDQPTYDKLGVDSSDKRVDIPKNQLVDAYEKTFGEIVLERGDDVPLNARYNLELRLPQKEVRYIILDYRNKNLATAIQYSDFKKIAVIYGADHLNGTLEELKKFDPSWVRK
jgi:hypothetical protein